MNDATGPLQSDAAEQLRRDREQAHEIAGQARTQATHVAEAVAGKTPAPVADRGRQIAGIARRYPVPLAAAVVSGAALIWWTARRRQA